MRASCRSTATSAASRSTSRPRRAARSCWELARTADVFLQNYRPGVAERLGVDYATLGELNESLVYVSMSGYGEDGPYAHRPGQDLLLQAMSGALESVGRSGDAPQPAGQFLVDGVTAYVAFEGALAALLHRERTGEGQLVQVNMLDAILTLQMQELSIYTVGGRAQTRSDEPHGHSYIRSPYGIFETQRRAHRARVPVAARPRGRARRAGARRLRRRGRHLAAPRRDPARDPGATAHRDVGELARGVRGAGLLGRAGLRLRGRPRRRAGRAQRDVRGLRRTPPRAPCARPDSRSGSRARPRASSPARR